MSAADAPQEAPELRVGDRAVRRWMEADRLNHALAIGVAELERTRQVNREQIARFVKKGLLICEQKENPSNGYESEFAIALNHHTLV